MKISATSKRKPLTAPPPKSKKNKAKLLSLAGVWKDLDADKMIEEILRARHESPPSHPVG